MSVSNLKFCLECKYQPDNKNDLKNHCCCEWKQNQCGGEIHFNEELRNMEKM
jgi:hypothetical protein